MQNCCGILARFIFMLTVNIGEEYCSTLNEYDYICVIDHFAPVAVTAFARCGLLGLKFWKERPKEAHRESGANCKIVSGFRKTLAQPLKEFQGAQEMKSICGMPR